MSCVPASAGASTSTGSYGTNTDRGLGSVFGGVRVNPDVDVFGGAVYRTQDNYKDGNGTEIGNTGNEIAAGLGKITVRPADGHEIKLGAHLPGLPVQYRPAQPRAGARRPRRAPRSRARRSMRPTPRTTPARSPGNTPSPKTCCGTGTLRSTATAPTTTRSRPTTTASPRRRFLRLAVPGNNISGCVGDRRGYLLDTVGIDVHNTARFNFGDWRNAVTYGVDAFQDKVNTFDSRGNSNITTPGGRRTVSGGFVQLQEQLLDLARDRQRHPLRPLRSGFGDGIDRRRPLSPKITIGVTPVAGFTPYVSYAEGYRAPSITETLISGAHATGGGPPLFVCPGRHRRPVLLPAQPEPAAGGRQEQGSRPQPEVRQHLHRRRQLPRQVQRVPQRRRRLHRSRPFGPAIAILGPASGPVQPSSTSTRTSPRPASRVSSGRRCTTPACGSSVSPAT